MRWHVPYYEFTCRSCGSFDRTFAMAEVPASAACPACAGSSTRRFGGAALIRPGSPVGRLIDATARTASEPAVVGVPPRGAITNVTRNPLHRKLPRP